MSNDDLPPNHPDRDKPDPAKKIAVVSTLTITVTRFTDGTAEVKTENSGIAAMELIGVAALLHRNGLEKMSNTKIVFNEPH